MRRRLDLAAGLIGAPPVVLLDEPTTGLDPRSRQELWSVVDELRREGTTVLLTTRYLEEADQLSTRLVVLDHGSVIAHGAPNQLRDRVGADTLITAHLEHPEPRAYQQLGRVPGVTRLSADAGQLQLFARHTATGWSPSSPRSCSRAP